MSDYDSNFRAGAEAVLYSMGEYLSRTPLRQVERELREKLERGTLEIPPALDGGKAEALMQTARRLGIAPALAALDAGEGRTLAERVAAPGFAEEVRQAGLRLAEYERGYAEGIEAAAQSAKAEADRCGAAAQEWVKQGQDEVAEENFADQMFALQIHDQIRALSPAPSAAPTLCRFCVAQGRPPHTEGECPHHNRPAPSAAPKEEP